MALVTVNGTAFPTPSSYNGTTSTIVDSGRNVNGVIVSDVIREDVAKVSLTWKYLTKAQWAEILTALSGFYVDVKFFNQSSGKYETRQMYPGDREAEMFMLDKTGEPKAWLNCSVNLIEV